LNCQEDGGLHPTIQRRRGRICHCAWSLLDASELQPPETREQVTTVRFDGIDPLKHPLLPAAARQGRPKQAGVSEMVERARISSVLEAAQRPAHRVRRYRGLRLHLTRVFSHPAPPQQICSSSLGTLPDNFRLTNRPTTFKSLWRVSWPAPSRHFFVIQQCCTRRLLYTAKIHHLKLTKRNTNNRSLKTRRYPLVKAGVTAIRELKARRHQRAACGHVGPRRGLSHASTGQQRSTEKKPHLITATNQQPQALSCQTLQRSPAAITRV